MVDLVIDYKSENNRKEILKIQTVNSTEEMEKK